MIIFCDGCSVAYEAGDMYALDIEQPAYAIEEGFPEEIEMQLCEQCIAKLSDTLDFGKHKYEASENPPEEWSA